MVTHNIKTGKQVHKYYVIHALRHHMLSQSLIWEWKWEQCPADCWEGQMRLGMDHLPESGYGRHSANIRYFHDFLLEGQDKEIEEEGKNRKEMGNMVAG